MKYVPDSEQQIEINGSKIHLFFFTYNENNPYLFMLHGLSADTGRMKGLIDILKDKYNVISLDLPGFGRSKEFTTEENYIEYTSQLLSDLLKTLNYKDDNTVLFGASNGANIIINYIFNHESSNFKHIILFAPIYSHKNLSMKNSYKRFVKWITYTTAKGGPVSKAIQKIINNDKLYNSISRMLDKDARNDKEILDYQRNLWRLMKITHWGKTLKEFLEIDYSDNNIIIENNNIVMVYPKKDQYLDVDLTVNNFKKMFPKAKVLYYESVKHMPRKDFMDDEVVGPSIKRIIDEI